MNADGASEREIGTVSATENEPIALPFPVVGIGASAGAMTVRPYQTRENRIEGAVITLIDVGEELPAQPSPSRPGPIG